MRPHKGCQAALVGGRFVDLGGGQGQQGHHFFQRFAMSNHQAHSGHVDGQQHPGPGFSHHAAHEGHKLDLRLIGREEMMRSHVAGIPERAARQAAQHVHPQAGLPAQAEKHGGGEVKITF